MIGSVRVRMLTTVLTCAVFAGSMIAGPSVAASAPRPAGVQPASVNTPPFVAADPASYDNETSVVPPDAQPWMQYGADVAIDGQTAVVGALFSNSNAGGAYVYERVDGIWTLTAELVSPTPGAYEFFGKSVAIDGDTIVVGECRDQEGGIGKGAVHVFSRGDGSWPHVATITPTVRVNNGEFGCDVAISGDTIVAGSYGYNSYAGGAYVFRGSGATWSQEQLIDTPSSGSHECGSSVDVSGNTLVLGGPLDDQVGSDSGAAYVYTRSGTTWSFQQTLVGTDTAAGDQFGTSVAVDGNMVVAGAKYEEEAPEQNVRGSAYVFTRSGATWTQTAKLQASDGAAQHEFGYAVALDGRTAVVGAPRTPELGEHTGSAYIYNYDGTAWAETRNLASSDATADAWFGAAVAVSDNVTLVGAYSADPVAESSGEAYFYDSFYVTSEDTTLTVNAPGVVGNDWDIDPLDTVRLWRVNQPAHGTVSAWGDGAFYYVPDPGYKGYDSFTYQATDDTDVSTEWARVDIMVTPVHDYVPIQGADRYQTSAQAALAGFGDTGATDVVIATGRNFPDALGGSSLAGALDAPLLLVDTAAVPGSVADAIEQLGATHAVILGGPAAVSETIEDDLVAIMGTGSSVDRIEGSDRYDTARKIAAETVDILGAGYDGRAFVATGRNFPDALAAGPLAAAAGWPIYLVANTGADATTIDAMADVGVTDVQVLGGEAVVTPATYAALEEEFPAVDRQAGNNRYETAVAVARLGVTDAGLGWDGVGVATGTRFPDALAAGATLGRLGTVLVLTGPDVLAPETDALLRSVRWSIDDVHYFGGPSALSQNVRNAVQAAVEAP